jgi:hypothetical protein
MYMYIGLLHIQHLIVDIVAGADRRGFADGAAAAG